MSWVRAVLLFVLLLVLAGIILRAATPLPSLTDRTRSNAFADTMTTQLGFAFAPAVAAHAGLSGIHALPDPLNAFAARILLARAAERSIDAQYYIWHDDLTGSLLFEELRAAADRGVRVRLMLDDNTTSGLDPMISALNAHPRVEVRLFNPFTIRKPRLLAYLTDFPRLNRRMHNKSFTIDNQATIVGGRNIGDEYFGAGDGATFSDLDVIGIGPVVGDVSNDFDRYWASLSSYPSERILPKTDVTPAFVAARAARVGRTPAAQDYISAIETSRLVDQVLNRSLAYEWAPTRMLSDNPAKGLARAKRDELLFSKLQEALGEPARKLELVSGYFVPATAGTKALSAMARRGVVVRVLTNALEATDVPIVHSGYAKHRKSLLKAGVRLYEMRRTATGRPRRHDGVNAGSSGSTLSGGGAALHAKTFSVDGHRLFVGSFNFDPRSANLNTELGFVIDSAVLAGEMHDAVDSFLPWGAYEVRLEKDGRLYWLERTQGGIVRHDVEPGTTRLQRSLVALLSLLPIDWLL